MARRERDAYATPDAVVEAVARRFWADCYGLRVWDPSCGDGRMVAQLADAWRSPRVVTSDLATGDDFLMCEAMPPAVDILVTNPPWKPIREWIDHAFAIGVQRMILVCAQNLWSCGEGLEQMQRHRPAIFAHMGFRVDYLQRGSSANMVMAVSAWTSPCAETCRFEVWGRP